MVYPLSFAFLLVLLFICRVFLFFKDGETSKPPPEAIETDKEGQKVYYDTITGEQISKNAWKKLQKGVIKKEQTKTNVATPVVRKEKLKKEKSVEVQYVDRTKDEEKGTPLPTIITIFADKSFTFVVKTAPTSYLLKKAAKIDKGCGTPGRDTLGSVTVSSSGIIKTTLAAELNC